MRSSKKWSLVSAFAFALTAAFAADPSKEKPAISPLEPLAFLTQHDWNAALPPAPDGSEISIHATFTWSENHQAIRIRNSFVVNGKAVPHLDGLYAWNPQKRAIVFWYVDADGSFYEGTVNTEKETRVHDFQLLQPDGTAESFIARSKPVGDSAWENEILQRKDGVLTTVVKVRYEARP